MPHDLVSGTQVAWTINAKIDLGQAAAFQAHAAKMVASSKEEPGTLAYEWSLSPDGTHCHIYERYVDCAAVKIHWRRNADLVKQLYELCTAEGITIYGNPDEVVRERFISRGGIFMKPLDGFSR